MSTLDLLTPTSTPALPLHTVNYGFKEWAGVCELLAAGECSVILRRGGIAEGRQGFRFEHETFFLFPTLFHEQTQKLGWPAPATQLTADTMEPGSEGTVKLRLLARIDHAETLTDWATVEKLWPLHPWTEEVIHERFTWREGAEINLAVLRVFELATPWEFPNSPTFGGCRSWVKLPPLEEQPALRPVLDDATHATRLAQVRKLLG